MRPAFFVRVWYGFSSCFHLSFFFGRFLVVISTFYFSLFLFSFSSPLLCRHCFLYPDTTPNPSTTPSPLLWIHTVAVGSFSAPFYLVHGGVQQRKKRISDIRGSEEPPPSRPTCVLSWPFGSHLTCIHTTTSSSSFMHHSQEASTTSTKKKTPLHL